VGLRGIKRPTLLGIEDGDIGVAAADKRSSTSEGEHTRRAGGEEFDNAAERNFLVAMQVINCEAERGFQSGDPERGALKLDVTSPPVDGAANEACVDFFAKSLKVRRSSITIASGERNRLKVVRVAGVTAQQFWERLSSQ